MARKYLAISAISASIERIFNSNGLIINPKRILLFPIIVKKTILIKSWNKDIKDLNKGLKEKEKKEYITGKSNLNSDSLEAYYSLEDEMDTVNYMEVKRGKDRTIISRLNIQS